MINDLLRAYLDMPPETQGQIAIAFLAILGSVIAAIIGGFKWLADKMKQDHDYAIALEEEKREEMRKTQDAKFDAMRIENELRMKETDAKIAQNRQMFELFQSQGEQFKDLASAIRESTKQDASNHKTHSQDMENAITAIRNVGDILEVQVTHFQGMNGEIKKLNGEFEAVKTEIASHRQKVDKLLENFETSLSGKAKKEEIVTLKNDLDNSYTRMESRLNDLLQEIKALQVKQEPIEKEKENQ